MDMNEMTSQDIAVSPDIRRQRRIRFFSYIALALFAIPLAVAIYLAVDHYLIDGGRDTGIPLVLMLLLYFHACVGASLYLLADLRLTRVEYPPAVFFERDLPKKRLISRILDIAQAFLIVLALFHMIPVLCFWLGIFWDLVLLSIPLNILTRLAWILSFNTVVILGTMALHAIYRKSLIPHFPEQVGRRSKLLPLPTAVMGVLMLVLTICAFYLYHLFIG